MREEPLTEILNQLGVTGIHKSRDWLNGHCPFAPYVPEHRSNTDSTPSFGAGINDHGLSSFHCFTCKRHGIVSDLARGLAFYRNENYQHIIFAADQADLDVDFLPWDAITVVDDKPLIPLDMTHFENQYPSVTNFAEARNYLVSRGIKAKAAKRLDLRFHIGEKRVVFPVRDTDKQLYGFTGRTLLEPHQYPTYASGMKFPKVRDFAGLPKEKLILGSDLWEPGKPVLIQEGLAGHGYLHQIGADEHFNIGTTMGALLTSYQASTLIEFNEPVYLLYDNDPAGDAALFGELVKDGYRKGGGAIDKLIQHLPLFLPAWPEGKNDPDQLTIEEISGIIPGTDLYTGL